MKVIYIIIFNLTFIILLNAQINPANNKISVDISTSPQNNSFNYDSCFAIGKNLGMQQTGVFQSWSAIETNSTSFNTTILNIANIYYPAHNIPIDLTLAPIATNVLEVPSDLATTSFSSTTMINRFKRLLDTVKSHIPNITLTSLVIGSESDVYFGSNAAKWAQFTAFYNATSAYAKTLWPGLKVATELTFDGLVNQNSFAQTLNTNSDYIGVSYYPLNANYTVKPVSTIPNDFATLTGLYPSKQLCFYQYGYPSSATCNSSYNQQMQFITQTFLSWDNYATKIRMIDFTWLHDLSTTAVNYYSTYYGITNPIFLEYLKTLGLRDWNNKGTDKPALNELRCQAKQHGYNTLPLSCATTSIKENKTDNLTLYPNPCKDFVELINFEYKNFEYKIANSLGVIIKSEPLNLNGRIDLIDLNEGIYFIYFYDKQKNKHTNFKIVKSN